MGTFHDLDKPNRAYFEQPRSKTLPPLPPGYDWKNQIEKYSSKNLLSRLRGYPMLDVRNSRIVRRPKPLNSIEPDKSCRTEIDEFNQPRKPESNFNRYSGVFCHRGFYDQAMKIPENSELAIDYGYQLHGFRLHELDVKLHTNEDKSLNPRKSFLSHDADGVRTTAERRRWSRNDGRDVIGTILVTRGIDLEKNDYASTFEETEAKVAGLDSLLFNYEMRGTGGSWNSTVPSPKIEDYMDSTFQLDVSQPGDALAKMLAWFRYNNCNGLEIIIKGYNRFYSDGAALLEAVNTSYSFRTGTLIDTIQAHKEAVTDISGAYLRGRAARMKLATGSQDKTVRIWDSHTGKLERELVGHSAAVNSVALSYKDAWVVSGSDDCTVRVWNSDTGGLIHTLEGHEGEVYSVAFSNELTLVASGSADRTIHIWDVISGKLQRVLRGHKDPISSVIFSEEEPWMASASFGGTVRIWDPTTGGLLGRLTGHTAPIICMDHRVSRLATVSLDKTLRIWDTTEGKLLHTIGTHDEDVYSVALSGVLDFEVVLASGTNVQIWKYKTGELSRTFHGHKTTITCVKVARLRGTRTIISASEDGEVRIWVYQSHIDGPVLDREPIAERRARLNKFMAVVLVFYPQPILKIALSGKGLALKITSPEQQLEVLDYEYLTDTAMKHIYSFIDNPIPEFGQIIPEIVHSGLGLRYDTCRGTAVNPEDESPIVDPEILLASRLDRAMIEVSLRLRKLYPAMIFSSCTRLSDVYFHDSDAEYTADLQTGSLKAKLSGEHGIPARLRALHGGLYPQSDFVVADDPVAEIAARTWIDEYARLDRAQLMHMTYDDWIGQVPEVKEIVNTLNGKSWSNIVGRTVAGAQEQQGTGAGC